MVGLFTGPSTRRTTRERESRRSKRWEGTEGVITPQSPPSNAFASLLHMVDVCLPPAQVASKRRRRGAAAEGVFPLRLPRADYADPWAGQRHASRPAEKQGDEGVYTRRRLTARPT